MRVSLGRSLRIREGRISSVILQVTFIVVLFVSFIVSGSCFSTIKALDLQLGVQSDSFRM